MISLPKSNNVLEVDDLCAVDHTLWVVAAFSTKQFAIKLNINNIIIYSLH
jgi:hypothetical protein